MIFTDLMNLRGIVWQNLVEFEVRSPNSNGVSTAILKFAGFWINQEQKLKQQHQRIVESLC